MPHRVGSRQREFIITTPEGDICGLLRVVQAPDGRYSLMWEARDGTPDEHLAVPDTMRLSQFVAAWMGYDADTGLRLTG